MKSLKNFIAENYLAVLTFFFAISICQYTGNRGVFPIDSFSHFDTGYRILNGEHPFKDYWTVSGPFVDYLQGLIFYIFGTNWQTYLLNASLLNGLVSVATYYIFTNLDLNKNLSFFYAICFSILAYPSSGTPFVDHHSTFLSILGIYSFILAIKTNKTIFWASLPIFILFAFLSKQVPAFYLLLSISIVLFYHLVQIKKQTIYKIILILFSSSLLTIIFLILFFKFNSIDIKDFLIQYLFYPSTIGGERYNQLNYDLKKFFLDFKFIYISLFISFILIIVRYKKEKYFYKDINFKIFLINFFLLISLVQHLLITKNQIYIFFLVPLFLGFANVQLINLNFSLKKYLLYIIIILCIGITFKYHQRFNLDRKFHELNNVDFLKKSEASILNNKFYGLSWITPETFSKKDAIKEINFLKNVKKILEKDKENKILLTNYSIFSILLNENVSGFSRWYPGDNSAFPVKENIYFNSYKNFIISILNKRKIKTIYVLSDIQENNLTNYVDLKCFNKKVVSPEIIKFDINKECPDLFLWKNK
jgi:hypothetical protein